MNADPNITPPSVSSPRTNPPTNPRSITLIVLAWAVLHIGGLVRPGLLDDVDSIYIEIAREMLHRHDFVTPYIDGIRFFDKPPLLYWLAAGSMHLFGETDWAARLPLALLTLVLFLATYFLGNRLFRHLSPPQHPDRAGLYAALALATAIGPYLYTRFFIPDILLALWMTLAVHLFLLALDRLQPSLGLEHPGASSFPPLAKGRIDDQPASPPPCLRDSNTVGEGSKASQGPGHTHPTPLLPMLAFAAIMALNVLTKGLIGLVFPIAFALLYLALTHRLRDLARLRLPAATTLFLLLAAPWHLLAALRNPPIPLPSGLGLPAQGGWSWFYLYNEHIARFLSRRIPHDYGQTPVWLFWLFVLLWILPWTAFLPAALTRHLHTLRHRTSTPNPIIPTSPTNPLVPIPAHNLATQPPSYHAVISTAGDAAVERPASPTTAPTQPTPRDREAALSLLLWPAIILVFFTLSARQEYYSLPALPALALMAGGLLAQADRRSSDPATSTSEQKSAARGALRGSLYLLVPFGTLVALVAAWFALTAPHPAPGADLASLLAQNPDAYNLSLGHLLDLTGAAMGLFRGPLLGVSVAMLTLGPVAYLIRRSGHTYAANLTLAAAATGLLLCVHAGLVRFYPILGSKALAFDVLQVQHLHPRPNDLLLIDGELTSGSTLLFYTQQPVSLVNGRVNGPWYGSFWPDAPHIFETDTTLHKLWSGPRRLFLLTYHPEARTRDLAPFGPVRPLASAGGKTILTNR